MSSSSSSSSSLPSNVSLVSSVANISRNREIVAQAKRHGLDVNEISWEDTARSKMSSIGPNILDMSLRVVDSLSRSSYSDALLPMIRYPNFSDKTCDIPIENFLVTVGNESKDSVLRRIPLKEYLETIGLYVQTNDTKDTIIGSLYHEDIHILTSAQYCILPLSSNTVEFNVGVYSYQSTHDEPAVLVLVCSQKGTSACLLYEETSKLYFNNAGSAANYVAERLKDERKRLGKKTEGKMSTDEQERNALFIFQIPLKVSERQYKCYAECNFNEESCEEEADCSDDGEVNLSCHEPTEIQSCSLKGVDHAMLSVGATHSVFPVINRKIERDTRFPIRCTVQKYLVTDSQEITESMWTEISEGINRIYSKSVSIGSLVTQVATGRTTEWDPVGEHVANSYIKTLADNEAAKPMFHVIM